MRRTSVRGLGGFSLAVLLAAIAAAASGQPPDPTRAARDAVLRQLAAFRQGDFDLAYDFASSRIQQVFDREGFERMVRGGYPEIAHSRAAAVSGAELSPGGIVFVTVLVVGASGRTVEAIYEMVLEDGRWKVNGVVTRAAPGAAARA